MRNDPADQRIGNALIEYRTNMYRVAYSYMNDRDDALDVVQESCLKALRACSTLKNTDNVKAWLLRITANTALDMIKKNKRSCPMEELPDRGETDSYERMELMDMLGKLDDKCREVMVLRYFEDIKIADIARQTGENVNTIKSRLHRAIMKLHGEYEKDTEAL